MGSLGPLVCLGTPAILELLGCLGLLAGLGQTDTRGHLGRQGFLVILVQLGHLACLESQAGVGLSGSLARLGHLSTHPNIPAAGHQRIPQSHQIKLLEEF
jgi:hypothetical protein